jgi:hypothetical protein
MRRLLVGVLAVICLGCQGDLGPVMTVDGRWAGEQNGFSFSMNLTQDASGNVSGSALIADVGGLTNATVTGTLAFPALSLTLTAPDLPPVSYIGTMSQTSAKIFGKLNGAGANNVEVDVTKQR